MGVFLASLDVSFQLGAQSRFLLALSLEQQGERASFERNPTPGFCRGQVFVRPSICVHLRRLQAEAHIPGGRGPNEARGKWEDDQPQTTGMAMFSLAS